MTVTMLKPAPPKTLPPPLNVTVLRQNLTQALGLLTDASSKRATLPILGYYLLESNAAEQRLYLSATNLEVGMRLYIGAKVESSGRLAVPVKLFSDFVTQLDTQGDAVRLMSEPKQQRLLVQCGKMKASVNGLDPDEFPSVFRLSETPTLSFEIGAMRQLLRLSTFAASSEIARPVLQGVYLSTSGAKLSLAAADGFRVSIADVPYEGEALPACIIPASAMLLLDKILAGDKTTTHVRLQIETKNFARAIFQTDSAILTIQMIEGNYPDYSAIIPSAYQHVAKFNPAELLRSLKAIDVIAREGGVHTARFHFLPNHVSLAVLNSVGDGDGDVDCDFSETKKDRPENVPFTITFNTKFMIDALSLIDEAQAVLSMTHPRGVACLSPIAMEQGEWQYLVMPMSPDKEDTPSQEEKPNDDKTESPPQP